MSVRFVVVVAVLLGGATPISAQVAAPLTLQAAIDEALAQNPALQVLREQFAVARARPDQERFLAPPMLETQVWQWPINTLNPKNTNMYMFSVAQELPGRGKRALRAAVSERDADRAESDVAVRARDIVAEVKRTYADLLLTRASMDVHHSTEDVLRQVADVAQLRYAAGRGSQQDVVRAMVELSKYHDHLITLSEREELATARLNTLLNRPPQAPIGPLAEPQERQLIADPDTLQQLALSHQPELSTSRLDIDRAAAQLAVTERDYAPDFFAGGGYMLMPRGGDAWMATFGITWNSAPWSRGRLDARRSEAQAEVGASRARLTALENDLRLAVQQAYIRVKAAERRAALVRTTLRPQTEQAVAVARVAYQADRGDLAAVLSGEQLRIDTALEYYQALGDLDQAVADLEQAVGTDLTPDLLAPAPLESAGERTSR